MSYVINVSSINRVGLRPSSHGPGGGVPNHEYDLHDLDEGVRNLECACLIWKGENYIHQTKHDGLCD